MDTTDEHVSGATDSGVGRTLPRQNPAAERHDLTRRSVLAATAAGAAMLAASSVPAAALSAAVPKDASQSPLLDVARADDWDKAWLHLRYDTESRSGTAVPLVLETSQPAGVWRVEVASITGRTTFATSADARTPRRSLTVPVSAGQPTTVWVTPTGVGPAEQAGDRVTVKTPQGLRHVDVWIEPVGGQWHPAPLRTTDGEPTSDLGIVAMHATLADHGGEPQVVMWSSPRMREPHGGFVPDPLGVPGQWSWNAFALNDAESRVLDVKPGTTRETPLPAKPGARPTPQHPQRDNIFCGAAVHLPDGKVLSAAGHMVPPSMRPSHNANDYHNASHVYIYDPAQQEDDAWRRVTDADLDVARWYPTLTVLPDGNVLITSGSTQVLEGNGEDFSAAFYWDSINNSYAVFDPRTEKISRSVTGLVDTEQLGKDATGKVIALATYPSVFTLPGAGKDDTVIAMAECNRGWLYTYRPGHAKPLQRTGNVRRMKHTGSRSYPTYGAMVLLPFRADTTCMRILAVGGQEKNRPRDLRASQPATASAEILAVDTTNPASASNRWREPNGSRKAMHEARVLCDATLLADGTVLISGGSRSGWGDWNRNPVYRSELFDPAQETFTRAATATTDRRYHSTALLMLDGSVLKAGSSGGFGNRMASADKASAEQKNKDILRDPETKQPWMTVHTDAERYLPPYMWRRRPRIVRVHADLHNGTPSLDYGSDIDVTVRQGHGREGAGSRAALIRLGSITHGNDMDQRYVQLETTTRRESDDLWTVTIHTPANPASAPPGPYQLVILDQEGAPSAGRVVYLPTPPAPGT
ncbi:galactose oxidase early set domain-containing protein [Streptomyces hundungensis]|uniref:galactose oxidase early set domain-containing protein n=1 Tax=Streptomyces hundungensis TaxID=1077946 RepID=UPI0034116074